MIRNIRENFLLKAISLATSIMIWQYVWMERTPAATRIVMAEVQPVGAPPEKLFVELKSSQVQVEVTGPRAEVEALEEGAVKAVVHLGSARPESTSLRISDYIKPPRSARIVLRGIRPNVPVNISFRETRRAIPIEVSYNFQAPPGKSYSRPRLAPAAADVTGKREDLARVVRLQVYARQVAGNVRQEAKIYAVDREGVVIESVAIEPAQTTISMDLVDAAATRSLVVSLRLRGHPAPPYVVSEAIVEPDQVIVEGKNTELYGLSNIPTAEVSVDGLRADLDRVVPLQLPPGITVKNGPAMARVIVRVQDAGKPGP